MKFLKAQRVSENSVNATYSLDGIDFTVEWNSVLPDNGETADYDLQLNTASSDEELTSRVDAAIREGETDENPDLDLYLFVRDTFDRMDCVEI